MTEPSPAFSLRTFGGLELTRDGVALEGPAVQRKRLVLLSILAAAGPAGVARDTLLALLWEDSAESQARNALKQAIYSLRRMIGEGAIVGTELLRLDSAIVGSDVDLVLQAAAAGDCATVLAAARGAFLDGVHVTDAPELEHWLDAKRRKLHQIISKAGLAAAAAAERESDWEGAQEVWRQLSAADPLDATAARGLVIALASGGNRAAALQHALAYGARVQAELGLSPDTELIALAERTPAVRTPPRPQPAASILAETAVLPGHSVGRWAATRPRAAVAASLMFLIAVGVGVARSERRLPPDSDAAPLASLVPIRGMDRMDQSSAATLTNLLESDVRASGLVRWARERDARYIIKGGLVRGDHDLRVSISAYDTWTSAPVDSPYASVIVADDDSAAMELLSARSAAAVAGAVLGTGSEELLQAMGGEEGRPGPLRQAVAGEVLYRRGHFADAADAFERSVYEDSTFALGWYRLSVTCDWAGRVECSVDAANRAARLSDGLSDHWRLLVQALRAWHAADADSAEHLYDLITTRYPRDVEAWYQLGDSRFHLGPGAGLPVDNARAPFERALALDPHNRDATIHLARLAAIRHDARAADTLFAKAIPISDSATAEELRVERMFAAGNSAGIRDWIEGPATRQGDDFLFLIAQRLVLFGDGRADAARLYELLTHSNHPAPTRAFAHTQLAMLDVIRGRFHDMSAQLDAAEAVADTGAPKRGATEGRVLFSLLPGFLRLGVTTLLREVALPPAAMVDVNGVLAYGLAAVLHGRRIDALDAAARLQHWKPGVAGDSARTCAQFLRSLVDLDDGSAARASDEFDPRINSKLPWAVRALARYMHAIALERVGRTDDAVRWYASFTDVPSADRMMAAPSHYRRARLLRRLGKPADADEDYRRFRALWNSSDREYGRLPPP